MADRNRRAGWLDRMGLMGFMRAAPAEQVEVAFCYRKLSVIAGET